MSELRFEQLRGEQVVYAIHRQERTFLPSAEHCPLCPTRPGFERTEIPFPSFEIAVFENRFPAFQAPGGASEVVVYTDRHEGSLGTLSAQRAEDLMWVWRHRYQELGARRDIEYVMIFENRGVEVGVTLHHPHGQIYAYPFLPPVPALELAADARLGGCAVCELSRRELGDGAGARADGAGDQADAGSQADDTGARADGAESQADDATSRVVYESEEIVAYVPYAARWAYEVHVVMRAHRPSLVECEPEELDGLADALQAIVRGYDALWDREMPYVMAVHQAPTGGPMRGRGHVHVEFYPPLRTAHKLKYLAGSEQGAGTFISDTHPEESARELRAAIADVA